MVTHTWTSLHGHILQIDKLLLDSEQQINLSIECSTEFQRWLITFSNVSAFSILDVNFPILIYGFEIIDNKSRGWENSVHFSIRDFEEGKLSFHCEEINAYILESLE